MRRLAICGWDKDTPALLGALEQFAGLTPAAIGDARAAHLVRAREQTGLPCYQHLYEMLRGADYDAVLLGAFGAQPDPSHTREAARRGATLLLRGGHTDGETLAAGAQAALDYGTALAVVRPLLRSAGISFVTELVAAEPAWRPTFVSLEVRSDRDPVAELRNAVAVAARLVDATPAQVALSLAGAAPLEPGALAAHLRYAGGALIQCSAVHSAQPGRRAHLTLEAPAGSIIVRADASRSRIEIVTPTEAPQASTLTEQNGVEAEARRIGGGISADDARFAYREAAMLRALEGSLATGYVHPVRDPDLRASLRVLPGGGRRTAAVPAAVHRLDEQTPLHLVP